VSFTNDDINEITHLNENDLVISEYTMTFNFATQLPKFHYSLMIRASNAAGEKESLGKLSKHLIVMIKSDNNYVTYNTGTHGIEDFQVTTNNAVEITTEYSSHTTAGGALIAFILITNSGNVDFNKSPLLLALDRNTSLRYALPFDLYPGRYNVYVHDIEPSGTLCSGVAYPAKEINGISVNFGQGIVIMCV
jgi:pyruvate-formate lyase